MNSDHEVGPSRRPGAMTTAMRAVPLSTAGRERKLLRVGAVHAGRIREERTFAQSVDVYVGTRETNSFTLSGAGAPASLPLFEFIDDSYQLNFTEQMRGRVALAGDTFELDALKARAHAVERGRYRVALTEAARGKVVVGDVTFLFHFVDRSPAAPKAVLPAAVLRGPVRVDWSSTVAAAFSFLAHFLILGIVYSDWGDPVIDDDLRTAGLVDSLRHLPPPPPIEEQPRSAEPARERETTDAPQTLRRDVPITKNAPRTSKAASPVATDNAALGRELAQIDTSILGALANTQPATSTVLRRSEVAWHSLDVAAASQSGVGSGSGYDLPESGVRVRLPPAVNLGDWGTKARGDDGPGRIATVKGPRGSANIATATTAGGAVGNAARVVAGMRAAFRACYERGLAADPDAGGGIRLTIHVASGGEVSSVSAIPSGNLSASVVSCVRARAQAAQFDAPEGGAAVITVPVSFVKQ